MWPSPVHMQFWWTTVNYAAYNTNLQKFGRNPESSLCHANAQWVTKFRIKTWHLFLYFAPASSSLSHFPWLSGAIGLTVEYLVTMVGPTTQEAMVFYSQRMPTQLTDPKTVIIQTTVWPGWAMHPRSMSAPSLHCLEAPVSTSKHRSKAICPLVFLVLLLY